MHLYISSLKSLAFYFLKTIIRASQFKLEMLRCMFEWMFCGAQFWVSPTGRIWQDILWLISYLFPVCCFSVDVATFNCQMCVNQMKRSSPVSTWWRRDAPENVRWWSRCLPKPLHSCWSWVMYVLALYGDSDADCTHHIPCLCWIYCNLPVHCSDICELWFTWGVVIWRYTFVTCLNPMHWWLSKLEICQILVLLPVIPFLPCASSILCPIFALQLPFELPPACESMEHDLERHLCYPENLPLFGLSRAQRYVSTCTCGDLRRFVGLCPEVRHLRVHTLVCSRF